MATNKTHTCYTTVDEQWVGKYICELPSMGLARFWWFAFHPVIPPIENKPRAVAGSEGLPQRPCRDARGHCWLPWPRGLAVRRLPPAYPSQCLRTGGPSAQQPAEALRQAINLRVSLSITHIPSCTVEASKRMYTCTVRSR